MDLQEAQEIAFVGLALFQNCVRTILFCAFYGIYCLLFITGLYISSWKRITGWSKNTMLCLLVATFLIVTLYSSANLAINMVFLQDEVISPAPEGATVGQAVQEAVSQPLLEVGAQISNWTSSLIILIGDIIIIWRAWAVWMHNVIVKYFLAFSLLIIIGVNLADTSVDSEQSLIVAGRSLSFDWVFTALSLSMNVALTSLIAYQTWRYSRSMNVTSALGLRNTHVGRILFLLVESGAIFAIFQVLNLIFKGLDMKALNLSPLQFASLNVSVVFAYVAALNPLAIFILVETNNTYDQGSSAEQNTSHELTTFLES
ncbi:hypothetical protein BDP27DRAFT_1420129 [Rhodocollybia butyracea]|uniref:Uncharacterized protein n=1 Tax=Rhodocollybia butyracea TaxID=206335 RepID=A0A9P5U8T1_9AGAR|nr:hypothetical protein BDP27DRAFT_1420129 [Rhodocollybia butyracea]